MGSQRAVYDAAKSFLQKVTLNGPENPSILSFRASARNLYNSIPRYYLSSNNSGGRVWNNLVFSSRKAPVCAVSGSQTHF